MDDVERVGQQWWLLALLGAVSLGAGILAIAYPGETLLVIGVIFGCYLVLAGVFALFYAVLGDPESRALSAILGIVGLVAGVICIRRPGESLLALVVVLGVYLVVAGVVRLFGAFGDEGDGAWEALAGGVDLALGIVILAVPDISLGTLTILFGISLIIRGVLACIGAVSLRRLRHERTDVAGPMGAATA